MIRPAERKCPIHGGFLKQQSRRVEPPGMILQDPVPESRYGCPEEGSRSALRSTRTMKRFLSMWTAAGLVAYMNPERPWTIEGKCIASAAIDANGRSCGRSAI